MSKSGATLTHQNNILSKDFGNMEYNPPAVWYIGYSTSSINEDGTGVVEPTDPAYERVAVPNNIDNWENTTVGTGRQNSLDIEFEPATVDQGTIVSCGLFDTPTGGTPLYYADLVNPKQVSFDDVLRIAVGNLQVRLHASE